MLRQAWQKILPRTSGNSEELMSTNNSTHADDYSGAFLSLLCETMLQPVSKGI
jgi:hypothetical protein